MNMSKAQLDMMAKWLAIAGAAMIVYGAITKKGTFDGWGKYALIGAVGLYGVGMLT